MSTKVGFTIDGHAVQGEPGQSILDAATMANIYIPHLCAMRGLSPWGSCRVCTVLVNGRPQAACTMPIADAMVVENDTLELQDLRRSLVEMLFVEGNHYCMFCEKSGNCELQAVAYLLGILSPRHPYLFPKRTLDASHPDVMLDGDRCILCARCIRASEERDGKHVFHFIGRGAHKHIGVNAPDGLAGTNLHVTDQATGSCPVGCLAKKRVGFAVPIGLRLYDKQPIGTAIETGQGSTTTR